MNSPFYSVEKLYDEHKKLCPQSMLSKRAIRDAVRSGELPSIKSGNRNLICLATFESWRKGELHGR